MLARFRFVRRGEMEGRMEWKEGVSQSRKAQKV
jgi:hypothetical protein